MYSVSARNSRLPNKPSLRVRAWNRVLRDMTYTQLYTTLHDIIYDVGGYLLLSLLLGFYFFVLAQNRSPHATAALFPFLRRVGFLFFYISLYTDEGYPSGRRYLGAPTGLSTISISSSSPSTIKIILRRAARHFYDCDVLSALPSLPAKAQTTYFTDAWFLRYGGRRRDRKPSKPIYTLRSSAGYLLNGKRVAEL